MKFITETLHREHSYQNDVIIYDHRRKCGQVQILVFVFSEVNSLGQHFVFPSLACIGIDG